MAFTRYRLSSGFECRHSRRGGFRGGLDVFVLGCQIRVHGSTIGGGARAMP